MPQSSFSQTSFLGGEWSAYAQGRADLPSYRTAMNVCRNGYPIEEGAWLRRSGTRHAGTTLNGAKGRVLKFDFEEMTPYYMEFTNGALRFRSVAAQTGGLSNALPADFRLVTTNDNQQVSSISTANPAVVTTGAHGWSTGDQVVFLFGTVAAANQTPLLCNRVFQATVLSATTFSIKDPITGLTIDGSALGWSATVAVAGSVVVARVLKISTVYASSAWSSVRSVQAETQAVLLQGSYAPQVLSVTALPTSTTFATFSLAASSFTDGPYLDPPTDGTTITPSGSSGSVTLTASAITAINGGAGFKTTDIGRLVRLLSQPSAWNVATPYVAGNTVTFDGQYFACIQANTGQQPDIAIAYWTISTTAFTWSWAKITAWTSTTVVTATILGATLVNTNAVTTWRLGVYSDTTGYPTCGVYYEGRLWLSGSVANRVDASVVNGISGTTIDMTPTAADGTIADNNAFSYIFNATDVNPIYWMIGASSGISCGTLAGEWLIQASQLSDPITPTSIQAHRVTTYGCANVEPQHTELTICFVHRYTRKILEYFPDVFSGKYHAPNLSHLAKHLTKSGIAEIRYQQELLPVLWARCNNGTLIGATYKRATLFASQGPEFVGWHRHDLGSGRTVESIATGPSADGSTDALAMVTSDASVRHVEIMQGAFDVGTDIKDAWFVDDGIVPSGGAITVSGGVGTLTLNGLWHLNGETASVFCGGLDCGDVTVTNGSTSVSIDTDTLDPNKLSSAYLQSISGSSYGALACQITKGGDIYTVPCVVGYSFTSQGQLLRPDSPEQTRSPLGPGLGKPKRIHQFGALLDGGQGISFGTDFNKLYPANFKSPRGVAHDNKTLFSGVYQDVLNDTYSFENMMAWQITRPYPCLVGALSGFIETSER